MKHLNSNILCAVFVETTGLEIIEVAVVPVTADCKVDKNLIPFNLLIRPEEPQKASSMDNEYLMAACERGADKWEAAELFEKWFEKFNLKYRKKIMPLSHDWCYHREFIKNWLLPKTFDACFSHQYRDTRAIGLFVNDCHDFQNEACPYPKTELKYMCAMQKTDYHKGKQNVIDKASAIIELYRSLIGKYTI